MLKCDETQIKNMVEFLNYTDIGFPLKTNNKNLSKKKLRIILKWTKFNKKIEKLTKEWTVTKTQ